MRILIAIAALTLSACGSTWHIRKTRDSGTLAYRGYWTSAGAGEAVQKAIVGHCGGPYETVAEGFNEQYATTSVPVTVNEYSSGSIYGKNNQSLGYSGVTTKTEYRPMTVNNSYRTVEYRCAGAEEAEAKGVIWNSPDFALNIRLWNPPGPFRVLARQKGEVAECTMTVSGPDHGDFELYGCDSPKVHNLSGTFEKSDETIKICFLKKCANLTPFAAK